MRPNHPYKLLYSKRNHKQNKKTTYRLEKIFANDVSKKSLPPKEKKKKNNKKKKKKKNNQSKNGQKT